MENTEDHQVEHHFVEPRAEKGDETEEDQGAIPQQGDEMEEDKEAIQLQDKDPKKKISTWTHYQSGENKPLLKVSQKKLWYGQEQKDARKGRHRGF